MRYLTKEYRPGAIQGLKQTLLKTGARLAGRGVPERPLFTARDDVSFSVKKGRNPPSARYAKRLASGERIRC